MSDASRQMRDKRLVFYADDVEKLDKYLGEFLKLSKAKCAMLIDKEGHMVTRVGEVHDLDLDTISALVAGSFAATKEMARLLGESEFTIMFHQGARDSIQLQLVGDRTLMAVLFDERTNMGLVRFYAQETSQHIEQILTEIAERSVDEQPSLSQDFSADAAAALDNLF